MRIDKQSGFAAVLRRFAARRDGNTAMLFALLIAPLLLAAGIAVDFSRAGQTGGQAQEAADAALLRVARAKTANPDMTDAELTALARKIFDSAMANVSGVSIDGFKVSYDSKTETFSLTLSGGVDTSLMKAAGVDELPLRTVSGVKLGKPPYMEVALVLDNTGSMNSDGKLAAMKTAAAELATAIFAGAEDQTKVALVPFSQYVNVGAAGANKFWMKDSGRSARGRGENDSNSGGGNSGDGSGNSGSGSGGKGNPYGVSKADLAAEPELADWNGCVGSRNYPANTENKDFSNKPAPEVYEGVCPNEIQPLTGDKALVLSKIEGMEGRGNTYIAGGLEWGWHVLTNPSPFREGVTLQELHKRGGIKVMVVLTDGENTRAPDYPTHDSSDRALANSLTSRLCEEIKADEIIVYSIAFGAIDAPTRSMLEDCASSPGYYFAAADGSALSEAFRTIATSMRMLSLVK